MNFEQSSLYLKTQRSNKTTITISSIVSMAIFQIKRVSQFHAVSSSRTDQENWGQLLTGLMLALSTT